MVHLRYTIVGRLLLFLQYLDYEFSSSQLRTFLFKEKSFFISRKLVICWLTYVRSDVITGADWRAVVFFGGY